MKEYRTNEELIDYLESKGVSIPNKKDAIEKIERYTYYSIVNTYKSIFKDNEGNYIDNVSFDEIYTIFEFDKELKNIIIKYYPAGGNDYLLNAVLFDIFSCEQDLASHCRVEDYLFVPAVLRLEKEVK